MTEPLSAEELAELRRAHVPWELSRSTRAPKPIWCRTCGTWDHPWPCAIARLLATLDATPPPPNGQWHFFQSADQDEPCPTCSHPSWAHDPGQAVMHGWATPPPPDALDVERLASTLASYLEEETASDAPGSVAERVLQHLLDDAEFRAALTRQSDDRLREALDKYYAAYTRVHSAYDGECEHGFGPPATECLNQGCPDRELALSWNAIAALASHEEPA